jgi:hypothetical protein
MTIKDLQILSTDVYGKKNVLLAKGHTDEGRQFIIYDSDGMLSCAMQRMEGAAEKKAFAGYEDCSCGDESVCSGIRYADSEKDAFLVWDKNHYGDYAPAFGQEGTRYSIGDLLAEVLNRIQQVECDVA